MIRHLRLAPAALIVLAVGSTSAFAQTEPKGDAPPELPPPAVAAPAPEALPPSPPAAPKGTPPLKVEAANGSSIKFGLLLQSQFQAANSGTMAMGAAAPPDGYSKNLFFRRARILVGGSLLGTVDYFIETDFANLFLAGPGTDAMGNAAYVKATPGMNIQDAFATWKAMGDMVKVDVGYMLPPLAHNALQGAGTLLGLDYFTNSFRPANSFSSVGASAGPAGRDLGVQLRGLVAGGLVEYRAGLFQGVRIAPTATEVGAKNFFRATLRLQINLLDPEPGFFYGGTYLGTKKVASIGGSFDIQDKYKYFAVDGIVDMPAGPGVVSAQANIAHWDGGTFVGIPKQTAIMVEAGYILTDLHLSPIVRFEQLKGTNNAPSTETRIAGGIGFWPYGHNSNLKAFFTQIDLDSNVRKVNQFNVQWQLYYF